MQLRHLLYPLLLLGCGAKSIDGAEARQSRGSETFAEGASGLSCSPPADGSCVQTANSFPASFGGLAAADAICAQEFPGSHFYRRSCDGARRVDGFGYAELELGEAWNCRNWAAPSSGAHDPGRDTSSTTGYETVAAVLPSTACAFPSLSGGRCFRICEDDAKPLLCCGARLR